MKFDDIKTGQEYIALLDHAGYGYNKDDVYTIYSIDKNTLIITILDEKLIYFIDVPFVLFDHDFKLHVVPAPVAAPMVAGAKHNNPLPYNIVPRSGDVWQCTHAVQINTRGFNPFVLNPGEQVSIANHDAKIGVVTFVIQSYTGSHSIDETEFFSHFSIMYPAPVQPAPISPPMPPGVSINTKTGAIVGVDPATEDDGEYLVYDTKPPKPERAPLNDFVPEKDKLKNYFMSKKRLSD